MTYDEISARIKAEYDEICKSCGGEDCLCCEIYYDKLATANSPVDEEEEWLC